MTFQDIPRGASVFLDANTLIYYLGAHPRYGTACRELLERIARQEVAGFTSAHVLADVVHRVMTLEAIDQLGWPAKGIAQRLRQHPAEVQKLSRFHQAVSEVAQTGIRVWPTDLSLITAATDLSRQYGLLTGDALIVATMQQQRLTDLASLDDDFDRVPGISRYAPV
jgi:predicted nucleic acid-binding protein